MPAQEVHSWVKRAGDAALRFAGERGNDICNFAQVHRVVDAERADSGHHLRAVDERKPLFCREFDRLNARAAHRLRTRRDFTLIFRQSLADHR